MTWQESAGLGCCAVPYGVTYGAGKFIAVAQSDGSASLYSPDGVEWAGSSMFSLEQPGGAGVTYAEGVFVSVGGAYLGKTGQLGSVIAVSDGGFSWTQIQTSSSLRGVAFGDGRLVAVGWGGAIAVSSNTTDWQAMPSGTAVKLNRVVYGGAGFVAVGESGTILSSTNGSIWSAAASGTANGLNGVAYGEGNYVAVGAQGTIVSSTDTVNWTPRPSNTSNDLLAVTYGNGTFVAVGVRGTILQSGTRPFVVKFDRVQAHPTGLEIHLTCDKGRSFRVQTSSNLVDWIERGIVIRPEQRVLLLDASPPTGSRQFYRTIAP